MANRQTREQLGVKPGDKIVIKGEVSFAKIDKLVDGDALASENTRRAKHGMLAADKPFRSISIENPVIVSGQGTPLATFYGQTVYANGKTGAQTMSIESKSMFAPTFGHIQNGKLVEIEDPKRNPDKGQVVYLMIEAYLPKGYNKLGSSFNAVVYEEGDINFYEAGGGLQGFGQALGLDVESLSSTPQAQPEVAQTQNAFGAPAQEVQAQPETQAAANPFGVQDNQVAQGNPFGANDANTSGQPESNPFA